jgi:hypothetical protein
MKVRQERLGHAPGSVLTMAVYTHTASADDRKIAQQLGEMLAPNGPRFSHDETPTIQDGETIQWVMRLRGETRDALLAGRLLSCYWPAYCKFTRYRRIELPSGR